MAEAVLSITLETLRNLLIEEARFLYGVGDQVKEIQAQLEMMKSFLIDADRRQHNEERVRTWIQQVRRLAYRTEDVLETYAVEVASKRSGKGVKKFLKGFACIFSNGKALHKVGTEIANIKSEITNLSTSCVTFGIKDLSEGERSREAKEKQRLLRQTYAHEVEEHFVGMENEILKLLSLIMDDEIGHRAISIWGMGGLGKTTLARKIFNHGIVRRSFEAFAWVCITQQCQIATILQDILGQLGHATRGDQPTLVRELYKILKEKKCLVILDDIWEVDDWNILSHAFPIREGSSKILLTTRIKEVAPEGFSYKLKHLSEAEGWELLQRKSLNELKGKDLVTEPTFEVVGKQIVQKCGCLPLAISVVGGILREKNSLQEWEMVNKEIDIYLERAKPNNEASTSVHKVLGLSYDELPYYLKPCFLHLGRYPEDATIWTKQVYLIWIAEGFVLPKHRRGQETLTDVAERYLDELASRCMVEIQKEAHPLDPPSKTCQLHDLMRDLCLEKGEEEDFLKFVDVPGPELPTIGLSDNERKLSLNFTFSTELSDCKVDLSEKVESQYLRTLYVHRGYPRPPLLLNNLGLKKLKLLRVLMLEYCHVELPRELCELIHLRFLYLRLCFVKELPSSVSSLPYLQNLQLRTTGNTFIPNIFWKMKQLQHIYLPERCIVAEKLQFNDLHQLETLHGFQSSMNTPGQISRLVNLRSFRGQLEIDSIASSEIIDEMNSWRKIKWINLEILGSDLINEQGTALVRKVLLCENLNELKITKSIGEFPAYEPQFCPNLLNLLLCDTAMEEDPIQFLKKLPKLRRLSLSTNAFVGKEIVCDAAAFPQLRELSFAGLPNLEKWRVDKGALPNLTRLAIAGCHKLEAITDGLNFSALKRFDIDLMPEEFTQKYRTAYDQERRKSYK